MPAITRHTTPDCALCYLDSARRAADTFKKTDPLMRESILRAAGARVSRGFLPVISKSVHASHTRRMKPWPSDKPAAA